MFAKPIWPFGQILTVWDFDRKRNFDLGPSNFDLDFVLFRSSNFDPWPFRPRRRQNPTQIPEPTKCEIRSLPFATMTQTSIPSTVDPIAYPISSVALIHRTPSSIDFAVHPIDSADIPSISPSIPSIRHSSFGRFHSVVLAVLIRTMDTALSSDFFKNGQIDGDFIFDLHLVFKNFDSQRPSARFLTDSAVRDPASIHRFCQCNLV